MTRDDIIRMARAAGIDWHRHWDDEENRLERFAAIVAAHVREECAKVCESLCKEQHGWNSFSYTIAVNDCADAIRARGEE